MRNLLLSFFVFLAGIGFAGGQSSHNSPGRYAAAPRTLTCSCSGKISKGTIYTNYCAVKPVVWNETGCQDFSFQFESSVPNCSAYQEMAVDAWAWEPEGWGSTWVKVKAQQKVVLTDKCTLVGIE